MKLVIVLGALVLLVGCADQRVSVVPGPAIAASLPDVDAEYEARFRDGAIKLKIIDEAGAALSSRAMVPFMRSSAAANAGVLGHDLGVEFHIFAIGQADSMLVIGPAPQLRTLLIDAGETGWNSRKNCTHIRERVVDLTGEARVDYLIVTHFHTDHAGSPRVENASGRVQGGGGIFCLMDGTSDFFSVGTLIDRGDADSQFKPQRQRIHQAIIDSTGAWIANGTLDERVAASFADGLIDLGAGVEVQVISTAGRVFDGDAGALANAEQTSPGTYGPNSQASPNDFSVGVEITIGDFELVTAGDLTGAPGDPPYDLSMPNGHGQIYTNVESYMVDHWRDVGRESDVEIYRVNHHGSQNSSTLDLAAILRPEIVIYSAGGRYHHPTRDIANRFLDLGADQMLTSSADTKEWGDEGFPEMYGNGWLNPVGEIFIYVPINGDVYIVSTAEQAFEYQQISDVDEAARY